MSQPNHSNPEWPPRSPHDALLSTPGGRARLRRLAERGSPSPSPIKRSTSTPSLGRRTQDLLQDDLDDEDEDDEETLQLQLQEIQARLKLKKLQKKAKASDSESESTRTAQVPRSNSVAASRAQSRIAEVREARAERSKSQAEVHVPVSPIRRVQPPPVQRSPGRILLGIDKGLKGSDISLKRAPNLRKREEFGDRLAGPFLQRPISQSSSRANGAASSQELERDRPKSFSERMAAVRSEETERQERQIRIKKNRSMAFDIDHEQMQNFKENPIVLPEAPRKGPEFSRDEVLNSYNKSSGLTRSKTDPNLRSALRNPSTSSSTATGRADSRASVDVPARGRPPARKSVPPSEVPEAEATQFEPYSSQHLSKRIIPHQTLTRTLTGKKPFLIPDLLRTVKGPDFTGPDIEEDVVVFGIICSKSEPKAHKPNDNTKNQKRGKFMVMHLTDLKWELDLFLFDTAFDRFWKLTPGTIIAILNPLFMPPPRGKEATGKFSLTLNSGEDTVLEIGTARDLGFCKSVKKDGKTCDSWVDKRHTEFCDFHVNLTLQKTHSKRMEVNTMTFGKGQYSGQRHNSRDVTGRSEYLEKKKLEEKTRYDKESHSQIYIGKSAANLLDDVDYDPDAFHRGSTKEERMTRRILAQEKERDLAKKLGAMGGGLGADYMRRKDPSSHPDPSSSLASSDTIASDAASLGLLGGKAEDVALSPIKRKRTNTMSGTSAMGWGSDLTTKLGKMKDGENLQPVKKKTRFVTEKGIREAGRESFGGEAVRAAVDDLDDDDDDDLDIVRE
ncbi:related to replication protein CDC23 [Phialocephala subalpina]|uniref:Related to replication protein CDC23 n=1 Tax=Phialocephala subalpina TaxID=576137 RepID=A0A1L7X7K8_9HELO|nr:related to replication protein CDC23 [Phialocephala subalpina]